MKPALIIQHGEYGPPGLLAEWAQARGIPFEVHRADSEPVLPEPQGRPFVASLGSEYSPADEHVPEVRAERELILTALDDDVPVLGLCFGGQMLAHALGGRVERAPEPELGWHMVTTSEPELVPAGPWLQWHFHRFTLPPGARSLAQSPLALQAFDHGPHLGVQFHPESTIEIVRGWARLDADRLTQLGHGDGEALLHDGRHPEDAARAAAYQLFDAFHQRARRFHREEESPA